MIPAAGGTRPLWPWLLAGTLLLPATAWAGEADVIGAVVRRAAAGVYDFDVTVRSRDTGWDRYADRIEVLAPDGRVLGTRVLEHPHDDEQPFTRDVYGVAVPDRIDQVTIRAHFRPVGYDGATFSLRLR